MRLGSDAQKYPGRESMTPAGIIDSAAGEGLHGIFFRTMLTMSPALDPGELRDLRDRAESYGMYLESGLGKVNPYGTAETPELRMLGDGDIVAGCRRIIEAASAIGITELWASCGSHKPFENRFAYDRFRTDAPWEDQLAATVKFLRVLAPIARDNGIHLNVETHEEITTFELVRLVEEAGPDAVGITFDTANVLQRAEHPVWATRRVAPYVRQMHLKDAGLFAAERGFSYQLRTLGEGMVDIGAILGILHEANPHLNVSMELVDTRPPGQETVPPSRQILIDLYDEEWIAGHPDLSVEELVAYLRLAGEYERRRMAEGLPDADEFARRPFGVEEALEALRRSIANVRSACERAGVPLDGIA